MGVPVLPDVDVILQRLEEGRLDAFINSYEWSKFECKASPYQLDTPDQKFELAKDVSSMANVEGGVILIGAKTTKTEVGRYEFVTEISEFASNLVNVGQMSDILREWLYPPLRELKVTWYPSAKNKEKGVVAIHVPRASEDARPVIVSKVTKETGKIRGNIFGLFERWQDEVTFFNVEQLHSLIRSGQNVQDIGQRIDALQVSLGNHLKSNPTEVVQPKNETQPSTNTRNGAQSKPPRIATSSVSQLSSPAEVGLSSMPTYMLRGSPLGYLVIPEIFASQQSRVRTLVQDPPKLRFGSFGVDGGGPAHIHRGQSWRSLHTEAHRLLEIQNNGYALFSAPADGTFLCWGRHQPEHHGRVNPVVLIESVYLFAELLRQIQQISDPKNVGYTLTVRLERAKQSDRTLILSPGLLHAYGVGLDLHEAPEDYVEFEATWAKGEIVSEELAYNCIAQVYTWFGFTHDKIPLTIERSGKKIIDVTTIKGLHG